MFTGCFRVSIISVFRLFVRCPDSSVGVAKDYGLDVRESIIGKSKNKFSGAQNSNRLRPTQPPTKRVPATLSPGIKRS
jgi:hypothetical protein